MNRFPLLIVAALLAAVSAPAQFRDRGRSARPVRGEVVAANPVHRAARGQAIVRSARRDHQARPVVSGRVDARRGAVPVQRSHGHRSHGHWETRCERVLVPGYWEVQQVPPVYGWVFDSCGHRFWGIVTPACSHRVWIPPRWEMQQRRVWVCH